MPSTLTIESKPIGDRSTLLTCMNRNWFVDRDHCSLHNGKYNLQIQWFLLIVFYKEGAVHGGQLVLKTKVSLIAITGRFRHPLQLG